MAMSFLKNDRFEKRLGVSRCIVLFLSILLVVLLLEAAASPASANDSPVWEIKTVDSAGNVGFDGNSLALDAAGYPHISYCDYTNSDLKYAKWTGSTWSIETVDSAGDVGRKTSIALDTAGYPHISYYDWTNGDLKYAFITLTPQNLLPTAIIDSITPNLARQGKETVSFIGHGNDSDGSVVAYNWSSSIDGLLNTSPSFTIPASDLSVGAHIIYFSVQDDDGAWSSPDTEILTIAPPNQPPVASFTYSPVNPGLNETITFNASASYDPDGSTTNYNWSFGDGNVTNTTELIVTHSYSSVGNYTVNLTVTDDEGGTNTTSRALKVRLKPPIATFFCSSPNPVVNETVTFNASGSYDPNGVITTYEFEFGDGTNGTGEVVNHSYSAVGTYTVNLTLTDNEGATNRTSQTIKVFSNIAYFDTEPGTYPSLSGTHNGTLTMTHSVNVSTIYLYPCVCSGGHIEYAKIWNNSWDGAEAHWDGYVGDWHNNSFDQNFTLVAGETYNYTIQTGSYPQVHHTPELLTAKGWITCSEFVDVNGDRHEDWIPAFKLWSEERLSAKETLRIGAFNIQVFGVTKASKPEVMDVLAKIIRTCDIVAIQEIRDISQTALPALVELVNSDGSQYDYVVSERLGRTTSKEQYAYIYNNTTVELVGTPGTYPEPNATDPFHREPYIASFKAIEGNFDVTLMVIHTDPDEATEEINALDAVVSYARSANSAEQDFIVMGDLNADCSYFDEDSASTLSGAEYYWCIDNSVDTTTKTTNCTYDRIIITNATVSDFTGDAGVYRFDTEYGLTVNETTAVSDHYPVYAEFWTNRDLD